MPSLHAFNVGDTSHVTIAQVRVPNLSFTKGHSCYCGVVHRLHT